MDVQQTNNVENKSGSNRIELKFGFEFQTKLLVSIEISN